MASTRRLTAILAADVASYSRLMGVDEEGTHERLRAHLRELIDPKIEEHRGHIVKNTGDGLLAEFASVVDAVRCAAEVQRGMIDRNTEQPDERRIRFRIGINLGDVIPFTNLSDDREQQYFADGITEDLTTDLSRIEGSFVISRNTAFTYRNSPIDTKQIGRELGVRYVLEGSVRRSGGRVRINAQLIDAESDAHLWAERFDGDISDLFTLQDEITCRIAVALNLELIKDVGRRIDSENKRDPDAWDLVMRGWAWSHRPASEATRQQALRAFE